MMRSVPIRILLGSCFLAAATTRSMASVKVTSPVARKVTFAWALEIAAGSIRPEGWLAPALWTVRFADASSQVPGMAWVARTLTLPVVTESWPRPAVSTK